MKFIKRFELYLESINNIKNYNGFTIRYMKFYEVK